jgi:hypothetical protein
MVALATAYVRLRLDTSRTKDDIDQGLRRAGGEKAASAKGRSISAAFSKGFEGGGSTFGRVAATMASKASILAGAVSAATPAVVQFVAALAPAAGVGAALPAVLTAIQLTSITAKVAVLGVGDAIQSGFGDNAKAAEKDLKQLHGTARTFAVSVIGLKKPLSDIQQLTANRFFAPLTNEIKPLAQTFFPLLRAQLPQTAGGLGNIAEEFAHVARQGPFVRALNAIFDQTQGALKRIKTAIGPVVTGISEGLINTAPGVGILADLLTRAAINFGNFLSRGAKAGTFLKWIKDGIVTIKQLIQIVTNLGAITGAVFGGMTGGSDTLLARLVSLTAQARKFVSSAQGGQVIADLFQTLGVFGEALRRSLAGVLPQIAKSLQESAPAAAAFATALSRVIVSVAPLLPALTHVAVQLIGSVIPALTSFAGWLGRNQGLLKSIAPVIIGYVVAVKAVAAATSVATVAIRAWSVVVGVAKVAQAGWTAVMWLSIAPIKVHTAAVRLSTSTMGTWIGVKAIEARAWLGSTANSIKATAAVVANRIAVTASAVATKAAAIAQATWTAVMAGSTAVLGAVRKGVLALNLAMRANPIGAVITIITLLVAALVVLYQRNETVRRIIDAVWAAIRKAIGAVGAWFTGTLVPSLQRALNQLVGAFKFMQSWAQRIFGWFATYVRTEIAIVTAIFNGLRTFVTVTIPNAFRSFQTAVRNIILGVANYIRDRVNAVLAIYRSLIGFMTKNLVGGFVTAVNAIRAAWSKVQEAAKTPVTFVVKHVINPLIEGYNKIAGVFGAPKGDTIKGFEQGGRIPGAPSSTDNRLAQMVGPAGKALGALKVATGEYIVNARDTARALPLLHWINSGMKGGPDTAAAYIGRPMTRYPGDGSEGFAFAKGGLVGYIKDVWGALSDPAKLISGPIKAILAKLPGSGAFHDLLKGMGNKLIGGLLGFVKKNNAAGGHWDGKIASGNVGSVQRFVQAQSGKPYIWASAGPNGFDCSGIVSAAYNVLKGRNPYTHTFSTSNAGSFFRQGAVGPLMAGWSHPGQAPAGASVGHMAGQIGGMPFESTGSRGVRVGNSTRRITAFAQRGAAMAAGGLLDSSQIKLLDRGGRWPSGSVAANLSGHTEHVLTGGPNGDISDLKDLLVALLEAVRNLGGDVAQALERPTRRAVQLGRGRGTSTTNGRTA